MNWFSRDSHYVELCSRDIDDDANSNILQRALHRSWHQRRAWSKHEEVLDRPDNIDSELVVGFVGPVGVSNNRFHSAATERLRAFGYHPILIRLSESLDYLKAEGLLTTKLASEPEFERMRSHMDAGDELRGLSVPGARGLLASAAVAKIASQRDRNAEQGTMPMPRYAWLISSLKHPAEVEVLRRVYGPGFFLVGLFATEAERKKALERGMNSQEAQTLINRNASRCPALTASAPRAAVLGP